MNQELLKFNPSLSNNYGRRFVIADIHGCYYSFKNLINKIEITRSDQLFLLGDYINRGPYSQKVLDLILNLIADGYSVFPLRGNHEQMLIDSANRVPLNNDDSPKLHKYKDLRTTEGSVNNTYMDFMKSLPFYFELDHFFLSMPVLIITITTP